MPQLDSTWFASQLFWLFVCFTLLYLLLSRLVLPPLQKVIASRKDVISSDLDMAQDFKSKSEQAKLAYEATLIKSHEEAKSLLSEAEAATKAQAEAAIKALDTQLAIQAKASSSAIANKKQELLDALIPSTLEFASLITTKMTKKSPTPQQLKHITNISA